MNKLVLHLSRGSSPELFKTEFQHSLIEAPRVAIRGKSAAAADTAYTFQWTPAVQALTVFFLRNAAWSRERASGTDQFKSGKPKISGMKSSLASSLDYAISKQPQWMFDMFGTDRRGRTLLRRMIRRLNPERKRPGPVDLILNENSLSPAQIVVQVDGLEITDSAQLLKICAAIEGRWRADWRRQVQILDDLRPVQSSGRVPPPAIKSEVLQQMILGEATDMLWRTDIFSCAKRSLAQQNVMHNPSVLKRIGPGVKFWSDLDENLNSAQRLGMGMCPAQIKRLLTPEQPIRAIVPWIEITPLVLFEYLKRVRGYNFEIDFEWGYTAEVRRAIVSGFIESMPDLCVLGIGPATTAVGDGGRFPFRPLMLLPNISHRMIVHHSALNESGSMLSRGEYRFLCEEASSPQFCFEAMERSTTLSRHKVAVSHTEPDSAMQILREGNPDLRMIMFFPHFSVNEFFNDCRAVSIPGTRDDMQENVLFASHALMAHPNRARALDIALRGAWLELRENPDRLSALVAELTEEPRFVQFFHRFTGMHARPGANVQVNAR